MEVGKVKIAEDSDFLMLKKLVDDETNWKLEYDKGDDIKVVTSIPILLRLFLLITLNGIFTQICLIHARVLHY